MRSGIWYGSPKPRCGEDDDADYYGASESELEGSGVWQTLERKKKDWSLASSEKKKLTHVYSHSHREVHTSRHDGEKA